MQGRMRRAFRVLGGTWGVCPGAERLRSRRAARVTCAARSARAPMFPGSGHDRPRIPLSRIGEAGALRRAAPWARSDRTGPGRLTTIMGNRHCGTHHSHDHHPDFRGGNPVRLLASAAFGLIAMGSAAAACPTYSQTGATYTYTGQQLYSPQSFGVTAGGTEQHPQLQHSRREPHRLCHHGAGFQPSTCRGWTSITSWPTWSPSVIPCCW